MKAADKMARRVQLHQRLNLIDEHLRHPRPGSRISGSPRALQRLRRIREKTCSEMKRAGYEPWPFELRETA
jgi:hypothetical protein